MALLLMNAKFARHGIFWGAATGGVVESQKRMTAGLGEAGGDAGKSPGVFSK